VRPALARDLTSGCAGGDADANAKTLGIFMVSVVRLVAVAGVEEKPSAPHARLVCIHLHYLLTQKISARKNRVAVLHRQATKKERKKVRARVSAV
jgi:hypothetical protein